MASKRNLPGVGWGRATLLLGLLLVWDSCAKAQTTQPASPAYSADATPSQSPGARPGASGSASATVDQDSEHPSRPVAVATPPAAGPPGGRSGPPAGAESRLEERLRRMEEAYLRMEESNRRIQSQYNDLQRRYDDLSQKLTPNQPARPSGSPATASVLSRDGSLSVPATRVAGTPGRRLADMLGVPDDGEDQQPIVGLTPLLPEANPDQDQRGQGAEGTGGRTGIGQQDRGMPTGGEGNIGRGSFGEEGTELQPYRSRMDRIGAGAEGTGGRTYPGQQPATVSGARARGEVGAYRPEEEGKEGESRAPGATDLKPKRHPGRIAFGEGLEFTSDDGEFKLQFHDLTQSEYRGFDRHDLGILNDQFFMPRQRWYFVGELTKRVGFYTAINRGYGPLDILDAFITLRFSPGVRLRFGRMKTPYLYEYFSIAEGDLIAPERSLFATNLALNRQMGFMFLGELFKDQLSYAAGLFNGPRRSFQDTNSAKDIVGNITWRPFLLSDRFKALNYFNIGGSWDVGYQDNNPPQPVYFETANDQTAGTGAIGMSPTFLHLNNNAIELGERVQWGGHLVWYYKSVFLMSEYGGIRSGYGTVNSNHSVPIDFNGWHVTASWFITGEQVTRRVNMVQPIRDFNFDFLKPGGQFNPGAVELFARYSTLDISRNIFSAGFADPNLWTNHVWATDIGLNWYLNFYTRIFLDWQHAGYGNEINVAPGRFSSTTDIYWVRLQIFF